MRVRRRPVPADARPAGCAVVLLVFSLVFAVTAIPALPRAGAVLYLVAGAAGTVLCAGALLTTAGQLAGRRAVLELDDDGVRLPAPWPWPRSGDRFLPWPDVAAAALWSRTVQRGRRGLVDRLAFLPTREAVARTGPAPSEELLALGLEGELTTHWSLEVGPGWDTGLDEVLAEVRARGKDVADVRSR